MTGPTTERTHTFRSAHRALSILGVVYRAGDGKKLAEVSAETRIDKATALRILSTLVAEGIVRRDPSTNGYGPDMRSWMYLVPSVQPALGMVSAVEQALDQLTEATGCTSAVFLPTQDGRSSMVALPTRAQPLLRYEPAHAALVRPLHGTAMGRCLLAYRSREELDHYLQYPLERLTEKTITSPTKLRRELAHIRRVGYAVHVGEVTPGVTGIAVPVRLDDGTVVAAIGLAVPGEDSSRLAGRVLPALGAAQQEISRLFGYEAWNELVQRTSSTGGPSASPWDTADPEFGEGPAPLVRTVSRMIRLMAAVMRRPEGASLRELARQRGLDKTTTWRLLNTLRAGDVLWQDAPNDRYRVSPRFWLRHSRIMRAATSLTRLVDGLLEELSEATGATAVFALPDKEMRNSIVCRFSLPRTALCYNPQYGPIAPLHVTATGKTYLAAQSRREVDNYVRGGLTALTGSSITSREELLEELDRVRKAGYALNREEMAEGIAAIAVPVYDSAGAIAGSVGIVPLASALARADVARWVTLLQKAARSLAGLLMGGWRERLGERQSATDSQASRLT